MFSLVSAWPNVFQTIMIDAVSRPRLPVRFDTMEVEILVTKCHIFLLMPVSRI